MLGKLKFIRKSKNKKEKKQKKKKEKKEKKKKEKKVKEQLKYEPISPELRHNLRFYQPFNLGLHTI